MLLLNKKRGWRWRDKCVKKGIQKTKVLMTVKVKL